MVREALWKRHQNLVIPLQKKSTVTVVSPSTTAGNVGNLNEGNVRITSPKNDTNISNMVIITDEKWKVIVDKLSKLDMLDVMAEDVKMVKTKLNDIETSLTFAHQEIDDLKKENKLLCEQIVASEINNKLESDKHEQYSRRENVRITGVKEMKDECTDNIVMNLSQKLGVAVQREDISVSHRVKSRKPSAPSSIICRFVIRNKKDELLLAARTKAKDVPDFKSAVTRRMSFCWPHGRKPRTCPTSRGSPSTRTSLSSVPRCLG